jgi:drug/metabolite transporter (DMT)-like permease
MGNMKPAGIVGILLIILGVVALAYGGFSFTTRENKKLIDAGPIQLNATVEKQRSLPLPPILGVAALAGGVVLLIVGTRK